MDASQPTAGTDAGLAPATAGYLTPHQAAALEAGLSPHLDALLQKHPNTAIGWDDINKHWVAIEKPPGIYEVFTHAPTRAELAIKLDVDSREAG